ncbi:MAG: S1C family serine protease [Roseburia sp.]
MQQQNENKFSFINEKIKEKPINKRKLVIQSAFTVGMAIVFGVIASLVFACLAPKFGQMFYPDDERLAITIPKDSIAETEATEQAGTEDEAEKAEPVVELPLEFELSLADYQKLQNKLYDVGRTANKFVVTVTGVKSDTDWFNNAYESKGRASGIIIGDNGQELLILTQRKVISDAQEVYVTFINNETVAASMKKYDGNTGIAVLSVPRSSVDESTMRAISVAKLGNSLATSQGMIAIAVGSPLGINYSILTGNITSITNSISTVDNNYTIFTTDIVGSSKGSGAIVNVNGEVVGLVMQDYSKAEDQNTLTAISISELKGIIEMLSNNQDVPYIGLELTTVTNDIAREYDIPNGAYIKEVTMDSPAMAAGLQRGDVITGMAGETVLSVESYESKLLALNPGERVEIVVQRQGTDAYTEITCTVDVSVLQ